MTLAIERPVGVFGRKDLPDDWAHEQVTYFQDPETGLRAIVAIHDTTLGPALGGTRFYPYEDESVALTDVLRLSQGMTYKSAVAGLPLGGGKAVILGDPATMKTQALLEAYGRFVQTLGGRYITAGDVGTNSDDLDVIGRVTEHVVGRNVAAGGSGDSAPMTALGVFQAMRAGARAVWGVPSLAGRTVGVEGVGKVGYQLIDLLIADGASVVAGDVNSSALERVVHDFRGVRTTGSIIDLDVDIYAPCAMGAILTGGAVVDIRAKLICGAANNQLAHPAVERQLADRGITWVPDYVANGGGIIQVAGERESAAMDQVRARVEKIFDTTVEVLDTAKREGMLAGAAADTVAEARISSSRARRTSPCTR
ncbi:Glu/Leu/Phe/Val dehydrogenase [Rhodococcus sp. NPDC058521]|uniref:Glu/Leu/Phe/Val family dehydrogenase n=1 Tax=Rhodococcus sp. NPDC058521 TaxID=3346536 RepID=UPI0036682ABE